MGGFVTKLFLFCFGCFRRHTGSCFVALCLEVRGVLICSNGSEIVVGLLVRGYGERGETMYMKRSPGEEKKKYPIINFVVRSWCDIFQCISELFGS